MKYPNVKQNTSWRLDDPLAENTAHQPEGGKWKISTASIIIKAFITQDYQPLSELKSCISLSRHQSVIRYIIQDPSEKQVTKSDLFQLQPS